MTLKEYQNLRHGDKLRYTGHGLYYDDNRTKNFVFNNTYIFCRRRKGLYKGSIDVKDDCGLVGWANYRYFEIVEKAQPRRKHKSPLILGYKK